MVILRDKVASCDHKEGGRCSKCGGVYVRGYDRDSVVCLTTGHSKNGYIPEEAMIISSPYGEIRCIYGGYECSICWEVLSDRINLASHMRTHGVMRGREKPPKVVDESIRCSLCPQLRFSNRNELGAHKRWHYA